MKLFNLFCFKILVCNICLFISLQPLKSEVRLAAIFGDNMVLQQQSNTPLWGWATPNVQVRIKTSWDKRNYTTQSDASGKWRINLSTPKADGIPYTINISDGKELILNNVLIGEVWICSGQSNMAMPLIGFNNQPVNNSLDAIVKSTNKNIRLFTVRREYSPVPLDNCVGTWSEAQPETVADFSATAYFFGRLINQVTDIPIGLIAVSWGGSSVKAWISEDVVTDFGDKVEQTKEEMERPNQSPAALFNGMLHPLIGYAIRGVIWYQGETDVPMAERYSDYFDAMVQDWRNRWQSGDFPVYFAQIAPYKNSTYNSAFLREAQEKSMAKIVNTGMTVLMDSDSPDCIHPAAKQEAGERLAYWALAETYGIKGFSYKSPSIRSVVKEGKIIVITFNDAPRGLTSYGKEIKSVRIAGEDKKWHPATVTIEENKIYVFSAKVTNPVAVRYAFESDSQAEIFSNQGLPLSSFRTDDW